MALVRLLSPGSLSNFSRNSYGKSFGLNGDVGAKFPLVLRPIENLAGHAIPTSCTSTATDEVLAMYLIPQGTLGVNSVLQIEPLWTFTSSANAKTCKVIIGGVTVYTSGGRTTSAKEAPLIILANRNSLTSQIQPYVDNYGIAGSGTPATYTIDFGMSQILQITGQRANAGDALTLEYFRILHFIGA